MDILSIFLSLVVVLLVVSGFAFWWIALTADYRPKIALAPDMEPQPTLTVYPPTHPDYPASYDEYEDLTDEPEHIAARRGDMETVTPQRIELIRQRIEAKKERPLTLEISKA